MKATQWLLIGGPCHGKKTWIHSGSAVICSQDRYEGENVHSGGRLYRIGRHSLADPTVDVHSLIRSTKLEPIA